MLRRGRLIVKMLAGRLHVLYEVPPAAAAGVGRGRSAPYRLRLVNPFFVNFTTLAFSPGKSCGVRQHGGRHQARRADDGHGNGRGVCAHADPGRAAGGRRAQDGERYVIAVRR